MSSAGRPVVRLVTLVVAATALAGCSGGTTEASSPPAAPVTSTSTPAATATTPVGTPSGTVRTSATTAPDGSASLADGRYPVRVTAVDERRRTVTVDVVQFFTGPAAAKAAKEDGGESPPPNDYWIRNTNPRTRTFAVTAGARITVNTLAAEESGSATKDVPRTLAQLRAYGDLSGRLFRVTLVHGKVTALLEQYLP